MNEKWTQLQATLREHLTMPNALVVSHPRAIVIAHAAELEDGRAAWHIAFAVGVFRDIIAAFPFDLPFVSFRRHGQDRLRIYSTAKLRQKLTPNYGRL